MTDSRNAPCPCGSGHKQKLCHALKPLAGEGRYAKPERDRALDRLMNFAFTEFHEQANARLLEFWGKEPPPGVSPEDFAATIDGAPGTGAFVGWFLFDAKVRGNRSPADHFAARAPALAVGERTWLDLARRARLRLYEIEDVRRDEGFALRDLWSGAELSVRERQATRQLVRWDLIAARIVEGPQRVPVIEAAPYAFNAEHKAPLLRMLRRLHRVSKAVRRSEDQFLRDAVPLLNAAWLRYVACPPMPELRTLDGEGLVLCRSAFDVADWPAVRAALQASGDFEAANADTELTWLAPGDGERRILGRVAIRGARLTLETMSRERAERGKALIAELAPGLATFRAMEVQTMDQALRGQRRDRGGAVRREVAREAELAPDVQAQLTREYLDRHYRAWLDQSVPALGGKTPRAAARLKSARPELVALLKTMSSRADRDRLEGRAAYDVGWIWAELGVAEEE
jgi:hypothetical protein